MREWARAYATLALRIDRHVAASGSGLIYNGPDELRVEVAAADPVPLSRLVADCDALRHQIPIDGRRGAYLTAQLTAMSALARQLDGADMPFAEYARQCLGITVGLEPEETFEAAHEQLDAALPSGPGSLADRLHAWQAAHSIPAARLEPFAKAAIAESIERTRALVELPEELDIEVRPDPGPHRGHYAGGNRGTIYLLDSQPFNLADLLYVVAHEGFPGHITESLSKARHLDGQPEYWVRFMISPQFVISEGIGLHAPAIAFPDDEGQRWITDNALAPLGITSDGSDFAAIHAARNVLWGVWANATILAAAGRTEPELSDYLTRWALLTDAENDWALAFVRATGMDTYVHGYFHGYRLLRTWLNHPDRTARFRTLLTEPVLPSHLQMA